MSKVNGGMAEAADPLAERTVGIARASAPMCDWHGEVIEESNRVTTAENAAKRA